MKRRLVSALLLCLSLILLSHQLLRAEGEIVVVASTSHYEFGRQLSFHLEAGSASGITQVILSFRATGDATTTVERPQFVAGPSVTVDHTYSLQGRYIKPFSRIEYWWTLSDAAGHRLTTEVQTFSYDDDRFSWQSLAGEGVTVYWYQGPEAFGQAALDVAVEAVPRISVDLGVGTPQPIRAFLYANLSDLEGALPPTGREWVGGQAYPELGTFVAAIPPDDRSLSTMKRVIPHEITHLLIYQAAGGAFGLVPSWLNEGLATLSEELPDPEAAIVLETALSQGSLVPLETLCGPFPLDAGEARLSYAQSASVVSFIRDRYGRQGLARLVTAYADGASCRGGVERALGVSLEGLETQWRASLQPRNKWLVFLEKAGPWLGLWGGSCLMTLLFLETIPLSIWRRRREAQEESPANETTG
ncbi:MAG TPA: hypothetical protein EYP49_15820 [Anaerolineae bacterium]|nr:hypothetical protein [Anaerolineae bacterium]